MPNCSYYASIEDHRKVLDWLFAEETCDVFESSSQAEQKLKRFFSADAVLAEFERCYLNGTRVHSVHLRLFVREAGPPCIPKLVIFSAQKVVAGRYRYIVDAIGTVNLYLSSPSECGLSYSNTNCNSLTRAMKWAQPEEVARWDFTKIEAFSRRFNRQIRKLGVSAAGSRAILPSAYELFQQGVSLMPNLY